MSVRSLWAYISHLVLTVHLLKLGNLDISYCSSLGDFHSWDSGPSGSHLK